MFDLKMVVQIMISIYDLFKWQKNEYNLMIIIINNKRKSIDNKRPYNPAKFTIYSSIDAR
jgi:hypothetical protein